MPFKMPKYPEILTDNNWQKKKGIFAKGTGETGVGGAMDAAEKVYYKVVENNSQKLMISTYYGQGKNKTPSDVGDAFKAVESFYKINVENDLCLRVREIARKAKAAAATWEKKTLVPKSSVKHANAVVKAAEDFTKALETKLFMVALTKDYMQALDDIEINKESVKNRLVTLRSFFPKVEDGLKTTKTVGDFTKFWSGPVRGLGTQLAVLCKELNLVAEMKIWKEFSGQGFVPNEDGEVAKKLKQIDVVLKRIKQAAESAG